MREARERMTSDVSKGRASYVAGTPEKYPASKTYVRILDAETVLAALAVLERRAEQAEAAYQEVEHPFDASEFRAVTERAERAEAELREAKWGDRYALEAAEAERDEAREDRYWLRQSEQRLVAEVETLQGCTCTRLGYGEMDHQVDCPVHGIANEDVERRRAAEAVVAAMREALEEIAGHTVVSEGEFPDDNCDWHCVAEIQDVARAALSHPVGAEAAT